jgi:uroporphyrinogen-III synthase
MSLAGLSIVTLESRRADLVVKLVEQQGGLSFNAPSVRELPLEENRSCIELVQALIADQYDAIVLTTGVGLQYLIDTAGSIGVEPGFLAALKRTQTISRGPKSAAVLRRYGMNPTVLVPDPNTWREVLTEMNRLNASAVAVQEYGVSNPEFISQLEQQGRTVTPSRTYRWALPVDVTPLQHAAKRIVSLSCDIAVFLSSVQLTHLLEVARELELEQAVLDRLRSDVVAVSIGPVMNDALRSHGIEPNFIPKHPKLAICIRQLAAVAPELIARKRRAQ